MGAGGGRSSHLIASRSLFLVCWSESHFPLLSPSPWTRMWQEARKNEKKIRSLMVDHKKRVERKKDFYERIRRDPVEFLQVHASAVRIHIDSAISAAAENCLMPWRGDKSNMIDRFDARAHLEDIPSTEQSEPAAPAVSSGKSASSAGSSSRPESRINYERWKNLIHYEFSGASENKVLHQIFLEERDVTALVHPQSKYQQQQNHAIKKKADTKKAAIGYNYDSHAAVPVSRVEESSSGEDSDVEPAKDPPSLDMHACPSEQVLKINSIAQKYFIHGDDFVKFMEEDKCEAERIQLAKDIENEKSLFAGRKSRRERKALKDRRMLIVRSTSAAHECEKAKTTSIESDSSSSESDHRQKRSTKTEFITSFGGSSGEESDKDQSIQIQVKNKTSVPNNWSRKSQDVRVKTGDRNGKDTERRESSSSRNKRSKYRRRSRSGERNRKSDHRSRSQSRDRERHRNRHKSSPSRSRSRSKNRDRKRRSRSSSVDAFGRIRRAPKSPSPTPAAAAFPSLPVQTFPKPVARNEEPLTQREEKPEVPPPPLKRYYRHDLESEASASDSEKDQ